MDLLHKVHAEVQQFSLSRQSYEFWKGESPEECIIQFISTHHWQSGWELRSNQRPGGTH